MKFWTQPHSPSNWGAISIQNSRPALPFGMFGTYLSTSARSFYRRRHAPHATNDRTGYALSSEHSCLSPLSDHSKEYKKLRAEIKKKSEVSSRLQKKNKKNKASEAAQKAADASVQDVARQFKVSDGFTAT